MNYEQRFSNNNNNRGEGLQSSLNMLKQMEAKLSANPNLKYKKQRTIYQTVHSHTRHKTQPNELPNFSQRSPKMEGNAFTISEQEQSPLRSPYANRNNTQNHTYMHSQPTLVEINQNDYSSVKDVLKENRKLKKYINCLLQMNDYLKNQLVKRDTFVGVAKMGHSFQLQLMRMEIQYLKQLNKDKELQLRKNIHLSKSKRRRSKSKQISTKSITSERRNHYRSNSAYQASGRKNYESYPHINESEMQNEQQAFNSDQYNSHRPMKSMHLKKTSKKSELNTQYTNSKKKTSKKMSVPINSKGSFNKKKTQKTQTSWKKCRLCYI